MCGPAYPAYPAVSGKPPGRAGPGAPAVAGLDSAQVPRATSPVAPGRHRKTRGGRLASGPAARGRPDVRGRGPSAAPRISRRRSFLALIPLFVAGAGHSQAASASSQTPGATLTVVAHEDDELLFMSPDLLHAIRAGVAVRTVYLTAGDDGMPASYWMTREEGPRAAYALMAGTANSWTQSDAGVPGHPIPLFTLSGNPGISLAYLRLPDGNLNGSGFASTGNESLQKLWQGTIPAHRRDRRVIELHAVLADRRARQPDGGSSGQPRSTLRISSERTAMATTATITRRPT